MKVPTTPLCCPVCRRPALFSESDLLRLPHTVMFRCPYCRTVAVVETTGPRSAHEDGGAAAA